MTSAVRWIEIAGAFAKLGCISFGGPVAHIGHIRNEFVNRRRWLSDADYADLVALCQFLPGPASSQTVFGLGMMRGGVVGGLIASLCFTLPSALLMIAFAYGIARMGDVSAAGWLHGLKLAAVAVVAQAVWGMGRTLCPDRPRLTLAALSTAFVLLLPGPWAQVGVIALGAIAGWLLFRHTADPAAPSTPAPTDKPAPPDPAAAPLSRRTAAAILIAFIVILIALPLLARTTDSRPLQTFDAFYRSGALVFGGGHVVLPWLEA